MLNNEKVLRITRTGILIALMIVVQALSKPLGQYVTGSVVNLILILSILTGSLSSGIIVAVCSPALAFVLGFGHALLPLLPFVMLGNFSLVLIWYFIIQKSNWKGKYLLAIISGAIIKPFVLYFGIVRLVIPFLQLPSTQAAMLSASYSFPQVITEIIGGSIAVLILPILKKAIRNPA